MTGYKIRLAVINCQSICNAFGQFINVEVKWPGSIHDARVFSNCEVQKRFAEGKFKLIPFTIRNEGICLTIALQMKKSSLIKCYAVQEIKQNVLLAD